MKTLFLVLALIALTLTARAQSVSNIVISCWIQLDNGISITNTANSKNALTLAAATNSMNVFNLARASQDPPKVATTNLSNFLIEFNKAQFSQNAVDYDSKIQADLAAKIPVMSQADKDAIRAINAKY